MTSVVPETQVRFGNTQQPIKELEALLSPSSLRALLPLGSVSPEMASRLIDELMRVIEADTAAKSALMGSVHDTKIAEHTPYDAPPVYDQRSFHETNYQAPQDRPRPIVFYSAPQSSSQLRNGNISQPSLIEPRPLNLSKTHKSSPPNTNSQQPNVHVGKRGSRFILVDQSQIHPLHRMASEESNRVELNSGIPQRFPTRIDSNNQAETKRGHSPPPSFTSRRHSIDVNQSYMSLSDSGSIHHDFPQNSLLNYKKWMGAKSGSRGSQQKQTGPVAVEEKQPKAKTPAVSKSKSFFSHFKYEMHPTPMYYVPAPELKKKPNPGNQKKAGQRFSIDGSSSKTNSLRNIDTARTKSSDVSIRSGEKNKQAPARDDSKWPLAVSSRTSSYPPYTSAQAPSSKLQAPKRSTNLIAHLGWNTNRVPTDLQDFQHVEGWLANTHTESPSTADPLTPLFSEKGVTSTAATSPVDSNGLSAVAEGRRSAKYSEDKMQSRIISWVDLEGCTPEFVQSLQVLGIVEELELESTSEEVAEESKSILPTPTSKYMDSVFVEPLKSTPNVVSPTPKDRETGGDQSVTVVGIESPKTATETSNYAVQAPKPTISRSRATSQSSAKRPKPHVAPLIIPTTAYSIFPPLAQQQKKLPPLPKLKAKSSRDTVSTTIDRPQKYTFREEDSPTLPMAIEIPVPPRSSKRSRKPAGSPPRVEATKAVETISTTVKEEDAAPPIPTRIRPITPPQASFFAPKTGLSLRISRRYVNQVKSEWVINTLPSASTLLTCFSTTNDPLLSSERKLDFWDLRGQHVFGFQKTVGNLRVAETKEWKTLFVVRESGIGRGWVVSHEGDEGSVRWDVRVCGDGEEGREIEVWWGEFKVGGVVAFEGGKARNTYTVTVNPHMNYCIMAALTTVFDEWRVDEGFF